ncbi:hypothetical protein [Virgisporangium aurantiacum]|uniref:hypothetical protein n=1 Tax=Virgisporangium aurantiacum TaxID=175570 RepID=UPI0019521643|nr:hypothetical protein [Virgisporangium aurantiacum]
MTVVAASVTDRDLGPRQRFEQTVQRRLIRLDGDHEAGAAGGDLAGVASLGVQGVRDDDRTGQAAELGFDPGPAAA